MTLLLNGALFLAFGGLTALTGYLLGRRSYARQFARYLNAPGPLGRIPEA